MNRDPEHNRNAGNCIYQSAEATDDEICPMARCMDNYDPPEHEPMETSDLLSVDPVRLEEQFVEDRDKVLARFKLPMLSDDQLPHAESLSEDFALLAQRVNVEVGNADARAEAVRHLEMAYMMVIRGLAYG